jgi:hypothetical protein
MYLFVYLRIIIENYGILIFRLKIYEKMYIFISLLFLLCIFLYLMIG